LNGEITYSVDGGTPSGVTFDTDTHTLTYNTALDSAAIITIKATSTIDDDTSSGQVTINLMPSS
jgi:hypothetical protein